MRNHARTSVAIPKAVNPNEILGIAVSSGMAKIAIATSATDSQEVSIYVIDVSSSSTFSPVSIRRTPTSTVRRMFLRWNLLCVVCDGGVMLYDVPSLQPSRRQDTITNPLGCCAWSTDPNRVVMCCLGLQRGTVRIERFFPSKSSSVFAAHDSQVMGLAISGNGLHVATVSETGTLIRVHAVGEESPLLFEIRRYNLLPLLGTLPKLSSIFMSPSGSFVGLIEEGTRDTLNIYRTPIACHDPKQSLLVSEGSSNGISGLFSKYFSFASTTLWATISLPTNSCVGSFGTAPYTVFVGSEDGGNFFAYKFDPDQQNSISSPIPIAVVTEQTSLVNPDEEMNGWEVLTDFSSVHSTMTENSCW